MSKYITPDEWEPIDGLTLEDNALVAIKHQGHILIEAGPGAGKTELLAQKACYLLQTNLCEYPRKILAISFKVDAAANLDKRVNSRSSNKFRSRFSSMTYDSFAKKILDQFKNALPEYLRPQSNYEIITEKENFEQKIQGIGWRESINPLKIGWAKKQFASCNEQSTPETNEFMSLLSGFNGAFTSLLTFPMITILADVILKRNPYILQGLQQTYAHVFLDEFQDSTDLQYTLVKNFYEAPKTTITAVGDNKQSIMRWAGALPDIFEKFIRESEAEHIQLTMNHRSAPRLVNLQRRMYASLEASDSQLSNFSDKWEPSDGEIRLYKTETEEDEADKIVEDILEKINSGILPKEICILCKQKPQEYTHKLKEKLLEHEIIARDESLYQDLLKEPIIAIILNTITVALRRSPKTWEYIEEFYHAQFDYSLDESKSTFLVNSKTLQQKIQTINQQASEVDSKETLTKLVLSVTEIFGEVYIRSKFSSYKQGYDTKLIEKFVHLFYKELVHNDSNWLQSIDCFNGESSIPIMTIHKSKGLEYKAIYFIGLEDGAFWTFRNQSQEDRRAFFVAISRAIKSLSFTFCKNREKTRKREQYNTDINEFFELLQTDGVAEVIDETE